MGAIEYVVIETRPVHLYTSKSHGIIESNRLYVHRIHIYVRPVVEVGWFNGITRVFL